MLRDLHAECMGACTGPEPINYLEALFPDAPKFSAHKSDLHNRAEWIVDITTRVSLPP